MTCGTNPHGPDLKGCGGQEDGDGDRILSGPRQKFLAIFIRLFQLQRTETTGGSSRREGVSRSPRAVTAGHEPGAKQPPSSFSDGIGSQPGWKAQLYHEPAPLSARRWQPLKLSSPCSTMPTFATLLPWQSRTLGGGFGPHESWRGHGAREPRSRPTEPALWPPCEQPAQHQLAGP